MNATSPLLNNTVGRHGLCLNPNIPLAEDFRLYVFNLINLGYEIPTMKNESLNGQFRSVNTTESIGYTAIRLIYCQNIKEEKIKNTNLRYCSLADGIVAIRI